MHMILFLLYTISYKSCCTFLVKLCTPLALVVGMMGQSVECFNQVQYSRLKTKSTEQPFCAEHGYDIIVKCYLHGAYLCGIFSKRCLFKHNYFIQCLYSSQQAPQFVSQISTITLTSLSLVAACISCTCVTCIDELYIFSNVFNYNLSILTRQIVIWPDGELALRWVNASLPQQKTILNSKQNSFKRYSRHHRK